MKKTSPPPFRLLEVLRETRVLYGLHLRSFFGLAFLFALIKQGGSAFLERSVQLDASHITLKMPALLVFMALVILLISILFSAVIQRFSYNAYQLDKMPVKKCWEVALQKLPRLFLAGFCLYLLSAAGVALHVVPGILIFNGLLIVQPLILFWDCTAFGSIKTSFQWVIRHYFSVLNVTFVYLLLVYLPNVAINFFINKAGNTTAFGIDEVVAVFINALIFPYLCLLPVVVFHHLQKQTDAQKGA